MSEEHLAPWQELGVWEVDVIMKDPRNIVLEAVTKTFPKKKECKKAKWLSEEALQS